MDNFVPLRSELKLKIMLSLLGGEKKLAELVSDVGTRETTILHVLKEFEAKNLTTRSGGVYKLTSLGFMEAQISEEYRSSACVIEKFKDFWLPHDVTAIPPYLLRRIGALKNSTLVRAGAVELDKVYETFMEILMSSKKVTGISPIFHPDYVPVIEHLLSQGGSVQLILTSAVLKKTLASAKLDHLREDFEQERLKIFLREDLKVALTVTEKNFSLGLFNLNGEYDDKMDLASLNWEAIEWGEELFQDYLKSSKVLGLEAVS